MNRRLRYPTLVGQRFGQLEVIAEGPLARGGQRTYVCRCRCGNEIVRRGCELRKWDDPSCLDCRGPRWTLDDDQKRLIENYYEWMVRVVRQNWVRNFPDLEQEILSAAGEGMIYAAFYFDRSRSGSFCWLCISYVNKKIKADIKKIFQRHEAEKALLDRLRGMAVRWSRSGGRAI